MLASPAAGQIVCNTRDDVLERLATKYQEVLIAGGVTNSGGLVEVFTTSDGSTWTIIISTPQGLSCLVATGEGWRTKEPVEPEPESMAL